MFELLFAAVRLVQFAAAMQLFGIAVFATGQSAPDNASRLSVPLRRLSTACIVLLALSSVAWLALQTTAVTDDPAGAFAPATLRLVLLGTTFGHVWIGVLVIAAALLVSIAAGRRFRLAATLVLAAAMLIALGLVGHLAAPDGWFGLATRVSQIIHLLAAGFWLGSLLPLALCLRRSPDPHDLRDADLALRRFSGVGHLAVAATLATGVFNTWALLGVPPLDLADPYRALLLAKIIVVFVMIAMALTNRYVLLPRLAQNGTIHLRLSIALEIAAGATVVALVSVFGRLPI